MDNLTKEQKRELVKEALEEVKKEAGKHFQMLGVTQRLLLVQEKLPKVPMYSIDAIRYILDDKKNNKKCN